LRENDRLRTAHVLLITIKALANEIAKNLVLAGIGAITLVDPDPVSEEDLGAQFLVSEEDVGKNVSIVLSLSLYLCISQIMPNIISFSLCPLQNEI
jgi:ubiquitin-like 1-activating enzyme E1 A